MPANKQVAQGKARLLVGIVLDRSSSMRSVLAETVSGTNEQFDTLRQSDDAANTYVVAWSFNEQVSPIFTAKKDADGKPLPELIPVANLKDLDGGNYMPSGMTAMYDGVGDAIEFLSAEATPVDDVLVVVISDGQENASTRFNSAKIASQVEELQKAGWNFTYIGANQDLAEVREKLGFHAGNMLDWQATAEGTNAAHGAVGGMLHSYTATRSAVRSKGITARVSSQSLYDMGAQDDEAVLLVDNQQDQTLTVDPNVQVTSSATVQNGDDVKESQDSSA